MELREDVETDNREDFVESYSGVTLSKMKSGLQCRKGEVESRKSCPSASKSSLNTTSAA